ncbi:MAG: peptide chain release factor N(5)-glutamine methyltransferase [Candidatus Latescibacteria bacterium]|jgi:release factor glutamine methyltransferase|nr:peptide chain release factor N(5)-glutamine methyltransferase [Candidatus Latescibacterota bacterium]
MSHFDLEAPANILESVKWATRRFEIGRVSYPRLHAEILLSSILKCARIDLYVRFDQLLDAGDRDAYFGHVSRHMAGEPVQYIVGSTEFYSLTFEVSPSVLIPRPETEILVEYALSYLDRVPEVIDPAGIQECQLDFFTDDARKANDLQVVDIGVGSGTIGLSLACLNSGIRLTGTDVSEEALLVAGRNALALGVDNRVTLLHGSCCGPLAEMGLLESVDLLVSNPPYVRTVDISDLPDEIQSFEPIVALDGGEDGLHWYRQIIEEAKPFLRPDGALMLEIGADQAQEVTSIFGTSGGYRDLRIKQDYNGLDRVVLATRA